MDSTVNCRVSSSIGKQEPFPHNKFKWSLVPPQSSQKPPHRVLLTTTLCHHLQLKSGGQTTTWSNGKLDENKPLDWTSPAFYVLHWEGRAADVPYAQASTGCRVTSTWKGAEQLQPQGQHSPWAEPCQVSEELQLLPPINMCLILTCNTNNFSFASLRDVTLSVGSVVASRSTVAAAFTA